MVLTYILWGSNSIWILWSKPQWETYVH